MSTTIKADPVNIPPAELRELIDEGEAVLIDVREGFEHAAERIEPSDLSTLRNFDAAAVRERCGESRAVFYCQTGVRSADAAQQFAQSDEPTFHLAGGIAAWKRAGLTTVLSKNACRLDIMRQVQIVAGSLIFIGVLAGVFVSPWFYGLSGFVGAGLVFAGATGFCGMAKILGFMPWNRIKASG